MYFTFSLDFPKQYVSYIYDYDLSTSASSGGDCVYVKLVNLCLCDCCVAGQQ